MARKYAICILLFIVAFKTVLFHQKIMNLKKKYVF